MKMNAVNLRNLEARLNSRTVTGLAILCPGIVLLGSFWLTGGGMPDEKVLSSPPYPPQVWSSFASFASLSTSTMSSMGTMSYYQSNFSNDTGLNLGILITIVLIALLIFLELTQPVIQEKTTAVLSRLVIRFSTITWILFIIFAGILYTTVVMLLAT